MQEAAKVVSIHGGEISLPFTPRPNVVAELERALEMARNGEIVGVAAAFVHGDELTSSIQVGAVSRSELGCLEMLKAGLCDKLRQG